MTNKFSDWQYFQHILWNAHIDYNDPLTTDQFDTEVESITETIQTAAWQSTPNQKILTSEKRYPVYIRDKVNLKGKIRKNASTLDVQRIKPF